MHQLDIAGKWSMALDPEGIGLDQKWFSKQLQDVIRLPCSLDNSPYAPINSEYKMDMLTRSRQYVGAAWYQRTIEIPIEWQAKVVTLVLERCHWETKVWCNDQLVSCKNSLSVPHKHDLTKYIKPGETLNLTICVDNTLKLDVHGKHGAHSVCEDTQTNWNGIIGALYIIAEDPVRITRLRISCSVEAFQIYLDLVVYNHTGSSYTSKLTSVITSSDGNIQILDNHCSEILPGINRIKHLLMAPESLARWDEFCPTLYQLSVILESGEHQNNYETKFGFREINTENTQFVMNGRKLFLRGTHEGCLFPLTGHPPMDIAPWRRLLGIAKSYGLNHLRFHSWCPPQAAFAAADEIGFLLQVELPAWVQNVGSDSPRDDFLLAELFAIIDEYGNHPSFALISMGNEMQGDVGLLGEWTRLGKAYDPRHFYCMTTMSFNCDAAAPRDGDYYCAHRIGGKMVRRSDQNFQSSPSSDLDWQSAISSFDKPLISHEIGQYLVYPNYKEIPEYTGNLKPFNLESCRESLSKSGMLDQAQDFLLASGKWAAALYKEDIEAALRTPGQAGFILLDLHDYSGQGTALVGMLNAFWESKGLLSASDHLQYCSPTVPLLKLRQRVYETAPGALIKASAQVSHFGPSDIGNATPNWNITNTRNDVVASGRLETVFVRSGGLTNLGEIETAIDHLPSPQRLNINLWLDTAATKNSWSIWLYPPESSDVEKVKVQVTAAWSQELQSYIDRGGKAIFCPNIEERSDTVPITFPVAFWSTLYFPKQAGSLGIFCDPNHRALRQFPTDSHSNWQWHDLTHSGRRAFILNDAPSGWKPIIQVIDRSERNYRLGLVFEARIGKGHLIISSIDLMGDIDNRPVGRQLRTSLIQYLSDEIEQPCCTLSEIGFNPEL